MIQKISLYHFYNGTGGGVQSVIRNFIRYSDKRFEHHIIYTINGLVNPQRTFQKIEGSASEQVFLYTGRWNFYHTCRELGKFLPKKDVVVVAHDWLELGMMSNLGLQYPVVFFVHGAYEYYYQLAKKHERAIDLFIPVAESISKKLLELLPQRKEDIRYLCFPVPEIQAFPGERPRNITFIGRLSSAKGYHLLPEIASALKEKNISWHIFGQDDFNTPVEWPQDVPVIFYGNIQNEDLLKHLPLMKFLILPSLSEGMPLVIIEAMKAGVIPIVNDIDGGIQELIHNGKTGFKIEDNQVEGYIATITQWIDNPDLVQIQANAIERANLLFNPEINTREIEQAIWCMLEKGRRKKYPEKTYGSRLDTSWIPNAITKFTRTYLVRPIQKS